MTNFKNACIAAGIFACLLVIGHIQQKDMDAQEQERAEASEHRKARECATFKQWAARDNEGKLVCADSAPAWAMSSPLRREK